MVRLEVTKDLWLPIVMLLTGLTCSMSGHFRERGGGELGVNLTGHARSGGGGA